MPITSEKPIVLWTMPRSVSTAFERAFLTREEIKVIHEPYTQPYYFGPERISKRYQKDEPDPTKTYRAVTEHLLQKSTRHRAVFSKDMAYCVVNSLSGDVIGKFTNTFLIRTPQAAVPSLYRMSLKSELTGWDYFDPSETGFKETYELFQMATGLLGQDPIVVDASDLLNSPESILEQYCHLVGLPFRQSMLTWDAQDVPQWASWRGWHQDAMQSSGFKPKSPTPSNDMPQTLPTEVQQSIDACMPYYEALYQKRIRP